MASLSSDKTNISQPAEKIFNFLADFNNFEKLMPDQVTNWKSDENSCSFTVSGIGDINLQYKEKVPFTMIRVIPGGANKIPFTFELICHLKETGINATENQMVFEHEMPMMIAMMAGRPLQNLVDILSKRLKEHCESPAFGQ